MAGVLGATKHGQNVVTGYTDKVKPDDLAPVRSRDAAQAAQAEFDEAEEAQEAHAPPLLPPMPLQGSPAPSPQVDEDYLGMGHIQGFFN